MHLLRERNAGKRHIGTRNCLDRTCHFGHYTVSYFVSVFFNGRSDPVTFLERLDEACEQHDLTPDMLLPALPEILTDNSAPKIPLNSNCFRQTWTMATALNLVPPTDSDMDENKSVGLETADPKVGWIYLLKKDQLTEELMKFGLTPAKTVGEMRRDLVGFIRAGKRPLQTPVNPESQTTTVRLPPSGSSDNRRRLEQAKIHKWKLSFNGIFDLHCSCPTIQRRVNSPSNLAPENRPLFFSIPETDRPGKQASQNYFLSHSDNCRPPFGRSANFVFVRKKVLL
ncbi:hypothetical protein FQR65_LT11490 [Abscondita terminalis]|nr:hypothetical protein FQR65_LT11490 [Abscondita terminalis]